MLDEAQEGVVGSGMHWRCGGEGGTKGQWVFTDAAPGWGRRKSRLVAFTTKLSTQFQSE